MKTLSGVWGLLALLVGCSDYNLSPEKGSNGADDTAPDIEDSDLPDDPDVCEPFGSPSATSVDMNTECAVEYSEGSFTPVVEWSWGSSSFCGPPAAGLLIDSDGSGALDDGDMPVIVLYQGGRVVALWGNGSGIAWQTSSASYGQDGGFALGDVTGDGWPEVIAVSTNRVCALDGRSGTETWCTGGLTASLDSYGYNYPSISDLDGDGQPEVIVGNAILNGASGSIRGVGARGKGAAPYGGSGVSTYGALSAAVDLDSNGVVEVVTGNAAYKPDGSIVWANSGLDGLVAVADFDGDGEGEIVKTSGIYVTGMESNGTEVWGPVTYSGNLGAPAIDDLDGDGTPEIVFAAQNNLIAMEWGGSVMWTARISDSSGAAGPTLFDFEMDGYPEVLYADETSIQFFSGLDGSVKFRSTQHSSYTILETPIVADVDNDDQVEIILGHCSASSAIGAITVYGDADKTWPPGRKTWNQHGYQITNINDDTTVGSASNNFSLYNSFRSGDVGRPPSEYWDLRAELLDVCEDECSEGWVYVQARILNAGNIEAPAGLSMSLHAGAGGPVVATVTTTSAIAPGSSGEALTFVAEAAALAGTTPVVTADKNASGSGTLYECDENNNTERWTAEVCP